MEEERGGRWEEGGKGKRKNANVFQCKGGEGRMGKKNRCENYNGEGKGRGESIKLIILNKRKGERGGGRERG